MAAADREKWNRKYREKPALLEPRPPSPMLVRHLSAAAGKCAIDLACGSGRHTRYLLDEGFCVDAVDISAVVLERLGEQTEGKPVTLIETDLDTFAPQKERYDLAIMTNYLDRDLIRRTAVSLKKGALFFIETYMAHPENEKQDSNPTFLLQPGELHTLFDERFEILEYAEYPNETYEIYRMMKQGIVVRKK
jgi:SAM-dependent methyltransferase